MTVLTAVLRPIVKRSVFVTPLAVSRTEYCPGGASGPRVLPAHMMSPGKSRAFGYRMSHVKRFIPCFTAGRGAAGAGCRHRCPQPAAGAAFVGWPGAPVNVRITDPCASRMSMVTLSAAALRK